MASPSPSDTTEAHDTAAADPEPNGPATATPPTEPDPAGPVPAASSTGPDPADRPTIRLKPGAHKRTRAGHPWVYSNEIEMDAATKAIDPGTVVRVIADDGVPAGCGFFNPKPLISTRLIDPAPDRPVDATLLRRRLEHCLALRDRLIGTPHYRLVHAEADRLPGLVLDRYGDVLVLQANAAGIERLLDPLLDELEALLRPRAIVLRNDGAGRDQEGLPHAVGVARGSLDGPIDVIENAARYRIDPLGGQKTGWFHDQRDNRAAVAGLCRDARVLDVYSYVGAFAIQCARAGAREVIAVDRSGPALAAATAAAELNGVADRVRVEKGEAFAVLEALRRDRQRFDIVICDPPAFVKTRKDFHQGIKGYRKMVSLAAPLVADGGLLFAASCSHNVPVEDFAQQVRFGLQRSGRAGRILRTSGAAPDHPVHPALPESAYLKAQLLALD